ncbi:hypothetical protein OSI96_18090, partial [Mycobacterium ulcerans]
GGGGLSAAARAVQTAAPAALVRRAKTARQAPTPTAAPGAAAAVAACRQRPERCKRRHRRR